jgi:hypothetical protein
MGDALTAAKNTTNKQVVCIALYTCSALYLCRLRNLEWRDRVYAQEYPDGINLPIHCNGGELEYDPHKAPFLGANSVSVWSRPYQIAEATLLLVTVFKLFLWLPPLPSVNQSKGKFTEVHSYNVGWWRVGKRPIQELQHIVLD